MTTQEMRCVLVLAETLNFSKAAKELNVTQPAFSRMIARVEEELGFKLFSRNTRAVDISLEGEVFISALRQSYAMLKNGVESSRSLMYRGKSLNIAIAGEFVSLEVAPLIIEYREKHEDIYLGCEPMRMELIGDRLRSGVSDLGILFTNRTHFGSDFKVKKLCSIPLYVVVNKDHPFSERKSLTASDLTDEKIIVLETHAATSEIENYGTPLLTINRKFGTHLKESAVAGSTQESLLHVACGQAITMLTSTLDYLVPGNCVMIPFEDCRFDLIALWNKDNSNRFAKDFVNFLSERVPSLFIPKT